LRWRVPIFWTIVALTILEFPVTVAALALFGIADPDTYRTLLWEDGFLNSFNSSPDGPLYAAANYQSFTVPIIWSGYVTKFCLVITVLCMFIMLVKALCLYLHTLYPIASFLVHALEVGLWSYAIYGQVSPDTSDPAHPNNGPPWYITKSCSVSHDKSNVGYCEQAKASFYVSMVMLVIFSIHIFLALQTIVFGPKPGNTDDDGESSVVSTSKMNTPVTPAREWEMVKIPQTPGTIGGMKSPITPRTRAFRELEGDPTSTGGWNIKREDLPWSGLNREST
jgi:hypothetical protein